MNTEDQLRHAKRVIADQAIQLAAFADDVAALRREIEDTRAAVTALIQEQTGKTVELAGPVVRAVDP